MRARWLPLTIAVTSVLGCTRSDISAPQTGMPSLLGYVTQFSTNQVDVVDVVRQNPAQGDPIPVGQGPVRAILSPGGSEDTLFVANKTDGTISFVNRRTRSVQKSVQAGADPEYLTFETINSSNPDDEQYLFVSNPSPKTVTRINVATQNADDTLSFSNNSTPFVPAGIVADPDPTRPYIYVVSSTVQSQSSSSSPCSNCTTTGTLAVITNSAGGLMNQTNSISLPGAVQPDRVILDPKSHHLYISDRGAAQVFMVDVSNPASAQEGQPIPINGQSGQTTGGTDGMALSPDGQYLYVTMPSANGYYRIATATQQPSGPYATGGTEPGPLAMSGDGSFLWIGNIGSSTIYSTDLTGNSCANRGSPCDVQGPVVYSLDSAHVQTPGDIVLAPGVS